MSFGILAPNFFWFFTTKNHFIDSNWCIDFTKKQDETMMQHTFISNNLVWKKHHFFIKWYYWNIEWTVEPWPHSNFVQPIFCTICFLISFCKRDHVRIRKIRYHWQNAKCACQNQRNIRLTLEKEYLQKITHMCSHMFCVVCFPLTKKGLHSSLLKVPFWKGSRGATAVPILILFDFVVGFHQSMVWFLNVGLKNVGLHFCGFGFVPQKM